MQLWFTCNVFMRMFEYSIRILCMQILKPTCSNSLTLSMGATAVLEMAAATPPAKKSFKKLITPSDMMSYLLEDNLTTLGPYMKPCDDPSNGRVLVFAPNISRVIIARGADDGSTRDRTETRSWMNIPGHGPRVLRKFINVLGQVSGDV